MSDPIDLNVKNFVRLVLFHQCKKIPIKKEEIVSKCILFCHFLVKINSQTFENILPKVKAILCDTFGFNLIELPFIASKTQASNNQSRKATLQATGKNSNQYTILSKFPQKVIEKESDLIERGILGFLVCILTLNNGSMESDVLFDILKKYDLTGAFDESLGDFVKQKLYSFNFQVFYKRKCGRLFYFACWSSLRR